MEQFGEYRIARRLGAGAFGEVFLARGPQGRDVALKVLHAEVGRETEVRARFEREGRIGRELLHPRVVQTLAAGEHDGRLYLVTEFVSGGGLDGLLERWGALGVERSLAVIGDLLAALAAVHEAGLIHRDVKPANLLLDARGRAKLADLGLARSTSRQRTMLTQEGRVLGTPYYIAPEQVDGILDIDIRCDLYAAGSMLFQCLTGRVPFQAKDVLAILRRHLGAPRPDPRAIVPSIPAELAAFAQELMAIDPGDRPADPGAALARLRALGAPAPAPAQSFPGTIPDRPGTPASFPGTIPDRPGTPASFPGTIPDRPGAPASFPGTIPDRPGAPASPLAASSGLRLPRTAAGEGLDRCRLSRLGPDGIPRHLFVYAGRELRAGRDGLDRADQDLCLRLLPGMAHAQQNRRVSAQHCRFHLDAQGAWLTDLGSSGGTTIDGARLQPRLPARLRPRCRVTLAGVFPLDVELVRLDASSLEFAGGEPLDVALPALFLRRPENARNHAYLLLPTACGLGLDELGLRPLAKLGSAGTGLVAATGLWLAEGRAPEWTARPLQAGGRFAVAEQALSVAPIAPRDQKE